MDILTKICVVVLVLLVIVAVPVFTTQATMTPAWKKLFRQEEQRRQLSDQAYRNQSVVSNRLQHELGVEKTLREKQARDLSVSLLKAQGDLEKERQKVANLGRKIDAITSRMTELSVGQKEFLARTERLESQISEARKRADSEAQKNIELYNQLKSKTIEFERLEKLAQFLKEELEAQKQIVRDLESRGTATGPKVKAEPGRDKVLVGEIIVWDAKNELASINIGSAKGVEKKMRLVISRGPKFVGYLRIESVELDRAAGVVVDKQLDPSRGDRVESMASLMK